MSLEKNNQELKEVIDNATDPEFLEREVKLKLNYKKAGEEVAFIYRSNDSSASSSEDQKNLVSLPNYKKWWYWLLGE